LTRLCSVRGQMTRNRSEYPNGSCVYYDSRYCGNAPRKAFRRGDDRLRRAHGGFSLRVPLKRSPRRKRWPALRLVDAHQVPVAHAASSPRAFVVRAATGIPAIVPDVALNAPLYATRSGSASTSGAPPPRPPLLASLPRYARGAPLLTAAGVDDEADPNPFLRGV